MRTLLLAAALAAATLLAGCGSGEPDEPAAEPTPAAAGEDLGAIKDYLLEHSAALAASTAQLAEQGAAYRELAESADFDYAALLAAKRDEVRAAVEEHAGDLAARPTRSTRRWRASSPACPSSSEFDVIIDAGVRRLRPRERGPVRRRAAAAARCSSSRATSSS